MKSDEVRLVDRDAGYAAATAAWPGITVPPAAFHHYILQRTRLQTASTRRWVELYIVCAVLLDVPSAYDVFDRTYLRELRPVVARLAGEAVSDDILQDLRERLYLRGPQGRVPGLARFGGAASLRRWLRVVATRAAVSHFRARTEADSASLLGLPDPNDDPELNLIRDTSHAAFEAAVAEAARTLTARQRNLLRHYYVDRLNLDELAHRFGVHRSTIGRQLRQTRDELKTKTHAVLLRESELSSKDMQSVTRWLRSNVALSLQRLL